jgi:tetratricopeptide (TPR) repeat protein|tara:strand:- start:249 stop:572 length:324 start_codon:yes stop_codon:yes gene_type:complete
MADYTRESVEASKKATELDPSLVLAWANLGAGYGRLGKHQKAVEALQKALEMDPSLVLSWYHLACSYGSLGNHERAIEIFRKVLSVSDNPDLTRLTQDGLKSLGADV